MDDTTTTARPKERTVAKKICVVVAAIYLPYTVLFLTLEWGSVLLWCWPIFPGIGIYAVHSIVLHNLLGINLRWSMGYPLPILLTLVFVSAAIYVALKAQKRFWMVVASLVIIASVFVFLFRQFLRG